MNDVLVYLKKISKSLTESSRIKQFHKSSYTILEGSLNERHGKHFKVEINASLSKTRSIYG